MPYIAVILPEEARRSAPVLRAKTGEVFINKREPTQKLLLVYCAPGPSVKLQSAIEAETYLFW
ncbi:hypothetical protein IEQ34_022475 [Dendrobium chrysotoxum]|uniref:Uncharacterized protein n=1 Tax=Dendrobium chrysotoxum TaxID=161865 RepID=A0AAV7FXK5_DENCH|nr:hypothetical protein IEQ34_022475 [Dendrobium chrysotoxum]